MKTTIAFLLLALALTSGLVAAADRPAQTFEGKYDWKQGGSDALKAMFKPSGENSWKVSFEFQWNGSGYNWKGDAQGDLATDGAVTGTVKSSDGRRTWTFEALLEDGVLAGKHIETTGDRKYETGTFSLKR